MLESFGFDGGGGKIVTSGLRPGSDRASYVDAWGQPDYLALRSLCHCPSFSKASFAASVKAGSVDNSFTFLKSATALSRSPFP